MTVVMADAPVLIAGSCSYSNMQQPLEQVEEWVAAAGGGVERAAAEEAAGGAVTLSVTDALLPEFCELRWCVAPCAPRPARLGSRASACVCAFSQCVLAQCAAHAMCALCSFGSAGVLALASTCKWYADGLKRKVRCATAIVAWPRERAMLYVLRSRAWSSCHIGGMPAPHQTVTETSQDDANQRFWALAVDDAEASLSLNMYFCKYMAKGMIVSVVEYQSRGMPHAHHLLWSYDSD